MKYFLTGVETKNKGAELMLYAILQEIRKRDQHAIVYMVESSLKQGIYYINSDVRIKPISGSKFVDRILNKIKLYSLLDKLNIRNIILFSHYPKVDYLIDGSGLRFSDKMPAAKRSSYWKGLLYKMHKDATKIIFLPQAFGPVELKSTQYTLKSVSKYADIIFARENISYNYLKNSGIVDMSKVKICTDFTSLVAPYIPIKYEHLKGSVCIIPNMQMIRMGVISLHLYLKYLNRIAEECLKSGRTVYLLNHEGTADENLINECTKELPGVVGITGLNALETKGLISTAYLCISSRFHGVASALNSSVPCLATSWSHKYKCIFEDYGQDDCVLSLSDIEADIKKINYFLDASNNSDIRKQLSERIPSIKQISTEMWNIVFSV